MFTGCIEHRQRPSFQYTAAVSFNHSVRKIFPRLVDFRPVRLDRRLLGRKYCSNGIPVRRVDLGPRADFRVWVLNRSVGSLREAVADISADRGSICVTIDGV